MTMRSLIIVQVLRSLVLLVAFACAPHAVAEQASPLRLLLLEASPTSVDTGQCPTNVPLTNRVVTQLITTNVMVTNLVPTVTTNTDLLCTRVTNIVITSTNIPVTNLVITNITIETLVPTNTVVTTIAATNVTQLVITPTNVPVEEVVVIPITFTNFVFVVEYATNVTMEQSCTTNIYFTNDFRTNIVITNVVGRLTLEPKSLIADVRTNVIPSTNLVTITNIDCVTQSFTNIQIVRDFLVPQIVVTNVQTTNIIWVTQLVTNTEILTIFLTNSVTTNFFLTNIVSTNLVLTNIGTTNIVITNSVVTNLCQTNLVIVPGILTNVVSTNLTLTNISTTNVPLAGLRFQAADHRVAESNGFLTIVVERLGDLASSVSVDVVSRDVSAVAGPDYVGVTNTLSFGSGVTSRSVDVTIINDRISESDETFELLLTRPVGAVALSPCVATVTIHDDDLGADLAVSKTARLATLRVGETNEWFVTVRNLGPAAASNIVVEEVLPRTGIDLSGVASAGTWDRSLGEWSIPSLAVGATNTLIISYRTISEGIATNCARIVRSGTPDPNTNNNAACATATWRAITNDIVVTKRALVAQTNVGGLIPFELVIRNMGPDEAAPVNVSEIVPPGTQMAFANLPPGTTGSPGTPGVWTLPRLTNGEAQTITVFLRGTRAGVFTNCATAFASFNDPSPANNEACSTAEWIAASDVEVRKTAATNQAPVGLPIEFTLTARNLGQLAASNVVIRDILPPEWRLMGEPAAPAGTAFDSATLTWSMSLIDTNSAPLELRLRLTRNDPGPATNVIVVVSNTTRDLVPGNNSNATAVTWIGRRLAGKVRLCESNGPVVPDVGVQLERQSGEIVARARTDATGDFAFTNAPAGFFRVRGFNTNLLAGPGHFFVDVPPATGDATNLLVVAFQATVVGRVAFLETNGAPAVNALVTYRLGDVVLSARTDANGRYRITNLNFGGDYVVSVDSGFSGAAATPPRATFNLPLTLRDCPEFTNILTLRSSLSISGLVRTCSSNGPAAPEVPLTLTSSNRLIAQTVSDLQGRYTFSNLWPGSYTITVSSNYTGLFPAAAVVALGSNSLTTNIVIPVPLYINGRVTENSNTGPALTNLTVRLLGIGLGPGFSDVRQTNVTDGRGMFAFTNIPAGIYFLTPLTNNPAFTFVPTNIVVTVGGGTCTNFIAIIANLKRAELVSIEVLQSVQGWNNDVRLVQHKPTFVRAHFQPLGTNVVPVLIDGARLLVRATGSSNVIKILAPRAPGRILAMTNAAFRRTNMASSLNFDLDSDVTRRGNVTMELSWTNGILHPREAAANGDAASNATVAVQFRTMPTLPVRWVHVYWTNHVRTTNITPTTTNIVLTIVTNAPGRGIQNTSLQELVSMYPVTNATATARNYWWRIANGAPTVGAASCTNVIENGVIKCVSDANGQVLWGRLLAERTATADTNVWLAIVAGGGFIRNWGGNNVATWQEVGAGDNRRHEPGHEVGHALGRPHSIHSDYGFDMTGDRLGACGETAPPATPNFPMEVDPFFGVRTPTLRRTGFSDTITNEVSN
jgi:uncharacterized repeat protein (TIGR01451 family)